MNGRLAEVSREHFAIEVRQSFGNCPQYIQARDPIGIAPASPDAPRREAASLSARAAEIVRDADTFFIASASADPAQQCRTGRRRRLASRRASGLRARRRIQWRDRAHRAGLPRQLPLQHAR
jgi:predicted pyridoxine 5'-phosphate oxidase superfamily flavin-nucleotide-binding protein